MLTPRFNHASDYDRHATLQRAITQRLLPLIPPGGLILDAGCGTGHLARLLPGRECIGLDIAPAMCRKAAAHMPSLCADMQSLPLADASIDCVVSSLALQWVARPQAFFHEALRVGRSSGQLIFATLGPQTLSLLRQAYQNAGLFPPMPDFHLPETYRSQLLAAGWQVTHQSRYSIEEDICFAALARRLQGLGAVVATGRQGLSTHLRRVSAAYGSGEQTVAWDVMEYAARKIAP